MSISDQQFLRIAKIVAESSHAKRLKVGAVIVKDNRIVSVGYNGTPPGMSNNCEDENGQTRPSVIHAETNSLLWAARSGSSVAGATMYCNYSPCVACAAAIIASGVSVVKYEYDYSSDNTSLDMLNSCGIRTVKVNTHDTKL